MPDIPIPFLILLVVAIIAIADKINQVGGEE